jgi:uncharacterized protein (TIGR04255 family)
MARKYQIVSAVRCSLAPFRRGVLLTLPDDNPVKAPHRLNVPEAEHFQFARNYVRTAVCELRFPALLEIDRKALLEMHAPLRKRYPHYGKSRSVNITPGDEAFDQETGYEFRSADGAWVVSVKHFALSLETSKYENFQDFENRLNQVVKAAAKLIDAEFFTRVGLRYVNAVPIHDAEIASYINPELVSPLARWVYGTTTKFMQEVRGYAEDGLYSFRHGFIEKPSGGVPEYMLDFDFYAENVEFQEVMPLVRKLHSQSYRFFAWSLGERARESMGKGESTGGELS